MRGELKHYLDDGAHYQAKGVLAYLQVGDIEESWNAEYKKYMACPTVARWENCREQGYVVSLTAPNYEQINIAWFEHRNSDSICAVKWTQTTMNAPTIDTAEFGDIYKDKYNVSYEVSYGEVVKMSNWIWEELVAFWKANPLKEKRLKNAK